MYAALTSDRAWFCAKAREIGATIQWRQRHDYMPDDEHGGRHRVCLVFSYTFVMPGERESWTYQEVFFPVRDGDLDVDTRTALFRELRSAGS